MNDRSIGNDNNIRGNTQSDDYSVRWRIASFEKTVTFSLEAGKAIIYINGGAAVAMLTFCGRYIGEINIWSILSLGAFGIGALAGAIALIIAYASQGYYTYCTDKMNAIGDKYNKWALGVGILSGILFLAGLLSGALAIWAFNGVCQQ